MKPAYIKYPSKAPATVAVQAIKDYRAEHPEHTGIVIAIPSGMWKWTEPEDDQSREEG